jgi:hypothetical protein
VSDELRICDLPSEFRGCQWDDGWEFDAPAVIYFPRKYRRYGYGGNTGAIDYLVEEICMDLANGRKPCDGGLALECGWRGWGARFDRRRDAWHVVYRVRWFLEDGEVQWEVTKPTAAYRLCNKKGGAG